MVTDGWSLSAYDAHIDAVHEICHSTDPLSLEIATLKKALEHVRDLKGMGDDEAAACARQWVVLLVLQAVSKHHHRSADLARALLENA